MTGLPRLTSTGRTYSKQWPAELPSRRVPIDPAALRAQLILHGIIRERPQTLAARFHNLAGVPVLRIDAAGRAAAARDAAAGEYGRREMPGPESEYDRRGPPWRR